MLPLLLTLAACRHQVPSNQPVDPVPAVVAALAGGSALATLGQAGAVDKGDAVGCWAWGASSAVGGVAAQVLAAGGDLYPAVEIDLSMCLALTPVEGSDVGPLVESIVLNTLAQARTVFGAYSEGMPCEVVAHIEAAFSYASGWVGPVLAEVASPDGVLSVSEVIVSPCGDPVPVP